MDRSRNVIVNQVIEQYLEASTWQMERIKDGIAAARDGKVAPAGEVFCSDSCEALLVTLNQLVIEEPAARDIEGVLDYIALDNPVENEKCTGAL
ncbi:MAG: hypothetical protein II336_03895 [Loktanella sp.]|nr:hypothetical protein [Loktanella sp.]